MPGCQQFSGSGPVAFGQCQKPLGGPPPGAAFVASGNPASYQAGTGSESADKVDGQHGQHDEGHDQAQPHPKVGLNQVMAQADSDVAQIVLQPEGQAGADQQRQQDDE